jgi:hypothetical protein
MAEAIRASCGRLSAGIPRFKKVDVIDRQGSDSRSQIKQRETLLLRLDGGR